MKWLLVIALLYGDFSFSQGASRAPASRGEKITLLKRLMDNNLTHVALEIVRSDIAKGKWVRNYEEYLNVFIDEIGTEQIDRLNIPKQLLKQSKNLKYISAKNDIRNGDYKRAVKKISSSLKPEEDFYANQLFSLASAQILAGDSKKAVTNFMDCEGLLRGKIPRDEGFFGNEKKIILDTCILNQARLEFEQGNFYQSNKLYDKISKSSPVWPEILFEQAWASFYQGNYNRTLGKLVTYKSPFFEFIFNPEVEVLEALSYMEICFYQNTQEVVNEFYKSYSKDAKYLKKFLAKYKNQLRKVGNLLINVDNRAAIKNKLLRRLMLSISKDLVYQRLIQNHQAIKDEIKLVRNFPQKKYISYLARKLKRAEQRQRELIGSYAVRILDRADRLLDKSFRGMSYIRLEILKKEKEKFFGNDYKTGKIGDLKNVDFNSTHYVWGFNGEFWADELGDYVFSLKSECKI